VHLGAPDLNGRREHSTFVLNEDSRGLLGGQRPLGDGGRRGRPSATRSASTSPVVPIASTA
jgi:hypothetical protein